MYESVDAVGPSCLPKLLDADVIAIVLSGAQSANLEVSFVPRRVFTFRVKLEKNMYLLETADGIVACFIRVCWLFQTMKLTCT